MSPAALASEAFWNLPAKPSQSPASGVLVGVRRCGVRPHLSPSPTTSYHCTFVATGICPDSARLS